MQITAPDFYKKFSCIAGECPATCCAGWQIVIDKKSLKRYSHHKGPFANRLKNDINWNEQVFRQYHHRCAFLNEENLCDIYAEAGPHMLCDTCRKYPRHIEEFEGLRELSLSLSCPEAARLLLSRQEPIAFITKEKPSSEETYDSFDYLLFTELMDTREQMLSILQNRSISLNVRLLKLLAMGHDFQLCLDRNELYRWEDIRRKHIQTGTGPDFLEKVKQWSDDSKSTPELIRDFWSILIPEMEVLSPSWHSFLKENLIFHTKYNDQEILQLYKDFKKTMPKWQIQAEQLVLYWLYTYFCGAVYDDQIFAKVKLALVCTLMIQDLSVGMYQKSRQPLALKDQIRICYLFSRELEHSDPNLNKMEELLDQHPAFSFGKLLKILC